MRRRAGEKAAQGLGELRFVEEEGVMGTYHLPHCLRITVGRDEELRATHSALAEFVKS